jgi:hypothetical protein
MAAVCLLLLAAGLWVWCGIGPALSVVGGLGLTLAVVGGRAAARVAARTERGR